MMRRMRADCFSVKRCACAVLLSFCLIVGMSGAADLGRAGGCTKSEGLKRMSVFPAAERAANDCLARLKDRKASPSDCKACRKAERLGEKLRNCGNVLTSADMAEINDILADLKIGQQQTRSGLAILCSKT
jgi:hypothetical protein